MAASEESQIIQIRDSILTELKTKREAKKEDIKVVELISQGKKATTFEELSKIITQLVNYRTSSAYRQHQTEIEALETRLQSLDPTKYRKQVGDNLDQLIKNEGLQPTEVNKETQTAIDKAKQSGAKADKDVAEEKVAQCGAQVNLNKLITKAQKALSTNKSKLELQQLAKELETYIKKDNYKKAAYQTQKTKVDYLLSQLRSATSTKNQNPPSPK